MKNGKHHILIVDDSANLRTVIKRYLSILPNVEFSEAGNGEIAEGILQESSIMGENVDLVVLDWMMPHMSGLEFLQRIRGTESFQTCPAVVMLTAETYSDQINAALKFNVSSYITKPFTQEDLANTVKSILAERELKHAV